jgi:hypothetical protein
MEKHCQSACKNCRLNHTAIKQRFGSTDVVEYAPITTGPFTAAADLKPDAPRSLFSLYLYTRIELVNATLPDMIAKGDAAILIGQVHRP